jgi:hypothetical protein
MFWNYNRFTFENISITILIRNRIKLIILIVMCGGFGFTDTYV